MTHVNLNEIGYKIFHLPNSNRHNLYKISNAYLSKHFDEIDTPTIKISSLDEYFAFKKENKDFNLDPNGYNLDDKQGWKLGELGIWASNFTAMKNFLNTDKKYLMLLEDDVLIDEGFVTNLPSLMEELPDGWDLFSCFSPENQSHKYSYSDSHGLVCPSYQDWSMLCYILNRKSVKMILDHIKFEPVSLPLDWFYFRQPDKFKCYTVTPNSIILCNLMDARSTFQLDHPREILNA
jgi:GR25 family glycosyltransferase involved in LPS biosynthesis